MKHSLRYIPFYQNIRLRMTIGFILLVASVVCAGMILGKGHIEGIILITTFAWLTSVYFTDKYVHKYPQRYVAYLLASHGKAAVIMAFLIWIMGWIVGETTAPSDTLWTGYVLFVFLDFFASVPYRMDQTKIHNLSRETSFNRYVTNESRPINATNEDKSLNQMDTQSILKQIPSDLEESFTQFIENNIHLLHEGNTNVLILDDIPGTCIQHSPAYLIIGRTRLNDVHRLNQFMQYCAEHLQMGGYFIIRYMPYQTSMERLKAQYPRPFFWIIFIIYFIWYRAIPKIPWLDRLYFSPLFSWLDTIHISLVKKRNRALSKAEVWGRLSFWGMDIVSKSEGDGELYILSQRVSLPIQNRIPSYYCIASLEKVGLEGQIIRTHKIRTMYPFSEFIQKRVYEDQGLSSTGKFANDFRLTEYGRFFRKYWLDELPQIYDWLRGEIKLVGIRATSQHFLSLYSKEFYNLYIQIKPGFISPIFDENTNGFDQIVEIEYTYLMSYQAHPIRTDIRYFFKTFTDIVFRGVRSK
jgi:lipopolysaccharide/colanic/teichoic acid biosynthesis glycosyltransferase